MEDFICKCGYVGTEEQMNAHMDNTDTIGHEYMEEKEWK